MTETTEEALQRRIDTLEKQNAKLRKMLADSQASNGSKYARLYEVMAQGVIHLDSDGTFLSANPAAARILGLSLEQLLGLSTSDPGWSVIRENGEPYPLEEHPATITLRTGKPAVATQGVFNPSYGGYRWILVHSDPVYLDDAAQTRQAFITFEDITERRQATESYNRVCLMANDLICIADINTATFLQVNPAFTKVLGWDEIELLARPFLEFVHPDDVQSTIDVIQEKLQQGEDVIVFVNRYRCKDGSYRILRWNSHPIPHEGLTYAIAHDITVEQKTQQALRYSENLSRTVIENSPIGISVRSATGQLLMYNNAWRDLWEISSERLAKDLLPRERFAMNERDVYLSESQQQVAQVFKEGGHFFIPEIHTTGVRSISGRRKWISQHFTGIVNSDGEVERVVVLTTDITERKEAQLKVERYARHLETMHYIDRAIIGLQSSRDIAKAVLDYIHQLIEFSIGAVLVLHPGKMQLETLYKLSSLGDVNPTGTVLNLTSDQWSVVCEAIESPVQSRSETLIKALDFNRVAPAHSVERTLLLPFMFKDEVLGFMAFGASLQVEFNDDQIELIKEVIASMAIALNQQRLFEQVRRDAETKTLLLQEVNHRVKNNLASIISFLTAKQMAAPDDTRAIYNSITEDLGNRVRALLMAHDLLSVSEWQPLDLSEIVIRVAGGVSTPQCRLAVDIAGDRVLIDSRHTHNLALIFNELVSNIVKHCPRDRTEIDLRVDVTCNDQFICIRFHDNGPGFGEDVLLGREYNIGLSVVQAMVEKSLHGQLELSNDSGAVVDLTFPREIICRPLP